MTRKKILISLLVGIFFLGVWMFERRTEIKSVAIHDTHVKIAVLNEDKPAVIQTQPQAPNFEEFKNLNSKVLLTAEEKSALQELLSDSNLIRKSYLTLTQTTNDKQDRFSAIDYLERAVAWKENPEREQVIESLRNMMLLDNLSGIDDMNLRKSYAGDKVEAYAILKEHAPEALQMIDTLPADGRIRKLLSYAENLIK